MTKNQGLYLLLSAIFMLIACQPRPEEPKNPPLANQQATPIVETFPPQPTLTNECKVAPPPAPISIDMIGWTFPVTEFYAKELEACNHVENLTINTQLLDSGSAHDQIRLALSTGSASSYEIIHIDDVFLLELGAAGWLLPLNDLIDQYSEQYNLDDIPDSVWQAGSVDGQIYGIPIIANTMLLMYRPDLLDAHGLPVPQTYDDVIAACQALAAEKSIVLPFTINLHAGWAWSIEFHNFLRSYGGQWLNPDSTPAFQGPAGVAAVEKMIEVVTACMGQEGLTWSIDNTEVGLETGDLAMATTWATRAANLDNPELSQFVGQIEFAPAPRPNPQGSHGGPAAVDFYAIPANIKADPDLIFQVIMEATDQASQIGAAQFAIVTRQSVANSAASGRYVPAALTTITEGSGSYGSDPAIFLARLAVEQHLPKVATGEMTAQEALDMAAAEYLAEAKAQGYIK